MARKSPALDEIAAVLLLPFEKSPRNPGTWVLSPDFVNYTSAGEEEARSRNQAYKIAGTAMKNELEMALSSRRSFTKSVARAQIAALSEFHSGLMRPDKASEFEPIRTPFDPADLSGPVQWLAKPQGEFLYQQGSPIHLSGEMWNRTLPPTSRFASPLFSNYWTGRFDGKWAVQVGIEKIEDFVSEMFRATSSDFALLTTGVDRKAKNQGPMSYSYQGVDLGSGVPGLYWINLFSDELAGWLGLKTIPKELAALKRLAHGGWMLRFGESPDHCRDIEILENQRLAIEWLGAEKFVDIRFSERKLDTPNWNSMPFRNVESTPM